MSLLHGEKVQRTRQKDLPDRMHWAYHIFVKRVFQNEDVTTNKGKNSFLTTKGTENQFVTKILGNVHGRFLIILVRSYTALHCLLGLLFPLILIFRS